MTTNNNSFNPPLGFAKFLSWSSLILILSSSIVLAIIITNSAKETLLRKQEGYSLLLAENLNDQIYQRYTLPLYLGVRGISLIERPTQFEPLDKVVQSTIHGSKINSLRVYNSNATITYSLNPDEIGRNDISTPAIEIVQKENKPNFNIDNNLSFLNSLFMINPVPGSYILRITYPLKDGNRLVSYEKDGSFLDILEFSQDITDDYKSATNFQWLIIAVTLTSSLILFVLLLMFIHRAEHILAERMKEKQKLERELNQHEKLASMGRVVSSIAHEIRNPLGIIRSTSELLLKRCSTENETSKTLLSAIHDESCRLSQTITDFLDYARPKVPRKTPVDMGTLIEQTIAFQYNSLAEKEIAVRNRLIDNMITQGDKDLLYRALYNIIANAIQAIKQDGIIYIDAFKDVSFLYISITDSGPGFNPDIADKLMDPFFTTKEGGTGLGLAIVQSIIISHNGSIEINNIPNSGAKVTIKLPLQEI